VADTCAQDRRDRKTGQPLKVRVDPGENPYVVGIALGWLITGPPPARSTVTMR